MKFAAAVALLAAVPLVALARLGPAAEPAPQSSTVAIPHPGGPDFGMAPEVVATADRNAVLRGARSVTHER
jgi:hypothetical protein